MRRAFFILLAGMVLLSFCSKKQEKPREPQEPLYERNDPLPPPQAASAASTLPQITSLTFAPEAPTALDDIVAKAGIAVPQPEGVAIRYQWFINGKEVEAAQEEKLPKTLFRKRAWIYCKARTADGAGAGEWFQSETIRVLNSPPQLQLPPVGDFAVPGEFQYQAAASDPDNDPLTFALVSPLDQGIVLDPASGALSWPLSEAIVKALGGEQAEIKITVSDDDGAKAEGTITLNFTSARE